MNNVSVKYIWVFWLMAIVVGGNAQDISALSKDELQEDLVHLLAGLERYNPAMYAYSSKEAFRKRITTIQAAITAPMDALTFYKHLCFAVEGVNEGHVTIGTAADPFYAGFLKGDYKSLPLSVQFLGEQAYVWDNLSANNALERGDEILSINGRSMEQIRTQIFKYTFSDGAIETFKQKRLSNELSARYFWFVERPDSFVLNYKKRGETTIRQVQLMALTRTEMAKWSLQRKLKRKRPQGINKIYNLTIDQNIATLTLRSFNEEIIKANELKSYAFYERIFKRLRQNKVKHLILDLRDNIGGMKEFGDDLLAFALKKKHKGIFRELLSWDGKKVAASFPKRNKWFFKGKWYILTNGGTYSTAALIAQYLHIYAAAVVIGAEAGSRYEGFAAGTYHHLTLPNSKIRIAIPNKWVKNKLLQQPKQTNRGLLPTYPIHITIDALLEERDLAKEKALELIRNPSF
ncbi:S41 family peptidase [Aureispira anguillae]|uniref:S41 family peptidase n=1 Tax=Aureispira anguillae TaxID=2864201 RepID=A0A915VK04_9BACT|nr:S41 family peptidase [Aureispira anguillae]BDS09448.1 S41 family peptidase [Aureispira anguillae]